MGILHARDHPPRDRQEDAADSRVWPRKGNGIWYDLLWSWLRAAGLGAELPENVRGNRSQSGQKPGSRAGVATRNSDHVLRHDQWQLHRQEVDRLFNKTTEN